MFRKFHKNRDIYTVANIFLKNIFFSCVYQKERNFAEQRNIADIIEEFLFRDFVLFRDFTEQMRIWDVFRTLTALKSNSKGW